MGIIVTNPYPLHCLFGRMHDFLLQQLGNARHRMLHDAIIMDQLD